MTQRTCDPLISMCHVGVFYWLKKGYLGRQRFWALSDVSMELHPGESLGVIGQNGAGKTTLLLLLAGILKPNRGTLRTNGLRASLLSLQAGFVPYLTGRENIFLSGMMLGLRRREIHQRLEEIIAFSELGDFIDQPVATYSSGMKARLGFSVAFQMDPDILLIDEVLGVGDAMFNEKSARVMKERIRSNKTIVLVSHNAAAIRDLCDRVLWIDDGVSRAHGDVESILGLYEETGTGRGRSLFT